MMTRQRCAICDCDRDCRELCAMHRVWAEKRRKVRDGTLSDWQRNTGGAVQHAEMMTVRENGARHSWLVGVADINRMARHWLDTTDREGWVA